MSQIIPVSGTGWTNLHAAAGITAGAPITLQNQGIYAVRLHQGTTAPATEPAGLILDTLPSSQSFASVSGTGSVWAKSMSGTAAVSDVHVQEVV